MCHNLFMVTIIREHFEDLISYFMQNHRVKSQLFYWSFVVLKRLSHAEFKN